ncbi:putative bifunctional diguanylate cyclase/phosphodiesterase [Sphingosinicella terrae]|uniref:putative bifunctional diguanylate cyclase/phosphodiesterase n=1 Tax=Sphingosinicella terrae TaxID=2172047 RepID=UPI000E0CEF14|nr:EAL domain-containing protein [Sphingosinicella terrae]
MGVEHVRRGGREAAAAGGRFSGAVARTVAAIVLGALVIAGLALHWATRESDRVSVERQAQGALHAIHTSIDELALQQETVAVWDDAASYLLAERRDMQWIHDNMGSWLHRIFRHDAAYILDGEDRLIYATAGGERVPLARLETAARSLAPLVRLVRDPRGVAAGRHDRLAGPLRPGSTVRTTGRTVHASRIALLGGRPAAVSVIQVKESTEGYVSRRGRWPVLVSIRYLDRDFLADLSERQLIASPRFSRVEDVRGGEAATPLDDERGQRLGFLIWRPELPGTRILWKLLPAILLVVSILAALATLLGRRLSHSVAQVESAEAEAKRLAYHDPLTGLPNRTLFQQWLVALAAERQRSPGGFAVLLLDLDEFKLVNDTLGHAAGDALLVEVARRLEAAMDGAGRVARLGGDEFALLLEDACSAVEVDRHAGRLIRLLDAPFAYDGKWLECRASLGACLDLGDTSAPDILKCADMAMYAAKAEGRGTYRLYAPEMSASLEERSAMLAVAKRALADELVTPFYQPKVDLRTGNIVGFEALLRCCPPGEAPFGPDRLAAAFDHSALAAELSDRMIAAVVDDVAGWRALGLAFGHVAINASAAELRDPAFAGRLIARLAAAGLPASCVQLEVTESVLLGRSSESAERCFAALAAAGVKLALDDFGTGFASLSHLKAYPVDVIKIDRSFIQDLDACPEDGAIVRALIGLAEALGLEVVAEGIETRRQRDLLAGLGCGFGQGYLFGRAMTAADAAALLAAPGPARAAA